MRAIRTFILRLAIDSASSDVLRGVLLPMPENIICPFADERGLLALLRQWSDQTLQTPRHQPETEQQDAQPGSEETLK